MSSKEPDLNDLPKSELPKVIQDKKAEAKARLKKQKDKYTTLFRKKPAMPTCKGIFPKLPKIDKVTFGMGGGFLMLVLAWYSLQYYELFIPFASGALRLFKYFLICTAILYFMVTFVQASTSFYWWYTSTLYYFRRFVDPLLNQKVKYYYYYFTDYINWIIYYPAKAYYFGRFVANIIFFLLVILPIMAFIAFFIGLLFSWIGEPKEGVSVMDPMMSDAKSVASVVGSAATGMFQKATGKISNAAKAFSTGSSAPALAEGIAAATQGITGAPALAEGIAAATQKVATSTQKVATGVPALPQEISAAAQKVATATQKVATGAPVPAQKIAKTPQARTKSTQWPTIGPSGLTNAFGRGLFELMG